MQTQTHQHQHQYTTSWAWSSSLTDVRVGCRNPERAVLCSHTHPAHRGLASGREEPKRPVLPFPLCRVTAAPAAPGLCIPKACEWARPDSTVWHGVGSCLAGSPTWPSPWIPWGLPGVHEPLLSCLPRLGHEWKGVVGALKARASSTSSTPPLLWAMPPTQLPGEDSGWPCNSGPGLGAAQLPPHPSAGLTAGFLVSMDSRQAPNVSFV